jgi:AcrR family transcriptional regulator
MGLKERRERERDEVRTKIMNAARDLFAAEGIEAVSMRKIAEAVEYSPTVIYQHFADKESLFRELCRADFATLAESMAQIAGIADPIERIRQIGMAYGKFGVAYPNHYRLMFMTQFHHDKDNPDEQCGKGDPDEDAYAFVKKTVVEALEGGRFRDGLTDPELISQTLWAGMHGVVSLQITKGNDPWLEWSPLERRLQLMVETLLRGLVRNPAKDLK